MRTKYRVSKNNAENYIRCKTFDWEYKTVFSHDIVLDEAMQKKYELFVANKNAFKSIFDFYKAYRKHNPDSRQYFGSVPLFPEEKMTQREYALFVRRGC